MVGLTLITTALEETWPDKKQPVLFLGEWCRLYSRKNAWSDMNGVVAPYHWNDRNKLHQDYLYLEGLYEELLDELYVILNGIHGLNCPKRYWRIIVGPWLGSFVQALFDRWFMLREVVAGNLISNVRLIKHSEFDFIPNDMSEFNSLYTNSFWNEFIYGKILDGMDIPKETVDINTRLNARPETKSRHGYFRYVVTKSKILVVAFLSLLSRNNEYFLISPYLPWRMNIFLQVKLGQIPKIWQKIEVPRGAIDPAKRKWGKEQLRANSEFPELVRYLIPRQIPVCYLEGFRMALDSVSKLPWPKNPKLIFTSNSYSDDDLFKIWAAKKACGGSPFLIGQHGGNFGMALWSFYEKHQIEVADFFLTWGWGLGLKKVIPFFFFKQLKKKIFPSSKGYALLVGLSIPQFSYHMYSGSVGAGQWQHHFEGMCHFVKELPSVLQDKILIRLDSNDNYFSQKARWRDRFPRLKFDAGKIPLPFLMKKARLCIGTYNATVYLESMAQNFPTIIFWDPAHWELRDEAKLYFNELKSAGIFHDSPESAAKHLNLIWDDIESWWGSKDVQVARLNFCNRYAKPSSNPLSLMETCFRKTANIPNPDE